MVEKDDPKSWKAAHCADSSFTKLPLENKSTHKLPPLRVGELVVLLDANPANAGDVNLLTKLMCFGAHVASLTHFRCAPCLIVETLPLMEHGFHGFRR